LKNLVRFDIINHFEGEKVKQRLATDGLHRNCGFQPRWIPIILLVTFVPLLTSCGESKPQKKPPSFQTFTQKDGLSSEMVYAITVQGEEVWFGTYGGGATLYNKESKTWKAYTTKGEPMEQMDDGDSIKWKNLLSYNHVSVILPIRIASGLEPISTALGVGNFLLLLAGSPNGKNSIRMMAAQRRSSPWHWMVNPLGWI
jgi:hypothetical protein